MNSKVWQKASSNIIISATFYSAAVLISDMSIMKKLLNDTVDITVAPFMDIAAIIALILSFAFFWPNISKLMTEEHSDVNLRNLTNIRTGYTFVITASVITYILLMLKLAVPSMVPVCFVFYGFRKMSKGYKRLSKSFIVPYKNLRGYKKLRTSTILFAIVGFHIYWSLFMISFNQVPGFIDDSTPAGEALQVFNIFPILIIGGLLYCALTAFIFAVIASFKIIKGWKIIKEGGYLTPDEY